MGVRQSQFGWRRLIGSLLPLAVVLSPHLLLADPPTDPLAPTATSVPSPATVPAHPADGVVSPSLIGRPVEDVRVIGNAQVSSQVILNQVKTHVGDKFSPQAVQEDYQKIYSLKDFSNVQAKVEPTAAGVIVIFEVSEEKLFKSIKFVGNRSVDTDDLLKEIDLHVGESIEQFRISLAKRAIIVALRAKNHPFAHVEVDMADLTRTGELIFNIVEGPPVKIQKIDFVGNKSFTANELDLFGKLNDQIKTHRALFFLDAGTFDPEQVDEDVASLRNFYKSQGFFDVKVGRKVIFSPDQTEVELDFLIDEGPRYKVSKVSFAGNAQLSDAALRKNLSLVEGKTFDSELVQHDIKEIVKAYSPLGVVYDPQSNDPAYLRVGKPDNPFTVKVIYHTAPGTVDLIYEISEGKPFRFGKVIIKGNDITQDKVILRELHLQPGQLYDSGAVADGLDRIRTLPMFSPRQGGGPADAASITPIGNSPDTRDILVQVKEQPTTEVGFGGQFSSNNGLGGNISITNTNFDATRFPTSIEDFFNREKAFTGAGETFSATFQPGIYVTTADVSFTEPYVFDQPFSNTDQGYYRERLQEAWYERYAGGEIEFGTQLNRNWSTSIAFQAEDVKVGGIQDYYPIYETTDVIDATTREPVVNPRTGRVETELRSARAPDILEHNGHNTQTNISLGLVHDATNHGPLTYTGDKEAFVFQEYGAMGGEYHFSKFTLGADKFTTLWADALDRKTVLDLHADGGYITPDAPFFDRFYDGGSGSVRGFEYRGISPRGGRDSDPIGGDFSLNATVQVSYPLYGDNFRGVIFTDIGTVEPDIRIHTIRQSVGTGIRVVLPFLSQRPLAFDVAFPINKSPQDDRQIFSFGVSIR